MVINQGDVSWVDLGDPIGLAPGFLHPHVVIQNDAFNRSNIDSSCLCNDVKPQTGLCTRLLTGKARVQILSRYMHDLGVILHFHNEPGAQTHRTARLSQKTGKNGSD